MRPRSHLLVTSAAVAALMAPGTALAIPDYRSPDAIDAASAVARDAAPAAAQDSRSPDAIDAATAVKATGVVQDRRSPDAADAADIAARASSPATQAASVTPSPPTAPQSSTGFDWGSAAIGAGGAIGLLAVAIGSGLALRRRHHSDGPGGLIAH